jgi:hypothetical protein
MQVYESLLFNNVLVTPAFVSTARVAKSFSETAPMPFAVHCEMQTDPFNRSGSSAPLLIIHVESEDAGKAIVQQIFDKKAEAVKLFLAMKSDSAMLKELLDLVKARLNESNE